MEKNNRQAQEEEKLALTSIYSEDFLKEVETGTNGQIAYLVRFSIELGEHLPKTTAIFTIHLPPTYPRSEPPVYELKEAYGEPAWITDAHRTVLKAELQDMFDATAVSNDSDEHGVVLFEWIEWLRDWLESSWRTHIDQHPQFLLRHQNEENRIAEELASLSILQSSGLDAWNEGLEPLEKEERPELTNLPPVFHSKEPLIDRKSVFVAHIAPVTSVEQVERVKQYLLSNSKIARATHNISAYRIMQHRAAAAPGKGGKHAIDGEVTISDCDDDGENAAGGRLLHLLEVCKCRNVLVVVSRWYGGTLLGPDRFKHINNVARELLNAHGFIP
ncbi:unnamed protein product [Calypogeia fissa]